MLLPIGNTWGARITGLTGTPSLLPRRIFHAALRPLLSSVGDLLRRRSGKLLAINGLQPTNVTISENAVT